MVNVEFTDNFKKVFSKTEPVLRARILKQMEKLRDDPELGKPMMYVRKGTRELYIPPFRLSYAYIKEENKIILLDFYHKDRQ